MRTRGVHSPFTHFTIVQFVTFVKCTLASFNKLINVIWDRESNYGGFVMSAIKPGGGGALQLHLYGGVWPQDWKIDPSAD